MELNYFYGVPTYIIVIFCGGPYDGEERAFPELISHIKSPISCIPNNYFSENASIHMTYKYVVYELCRDSSFYPSRDDNGRYKFKFKRIE